MAQQTINIGSRPNSGDGDPLRTAFDKVNDNFDELYAGGANTDLSGSVFGDDSTLLVDAVNNVIPSSVVLGTEATNWNTAYSWGDHSTQGYLTSETDSQELTLVGTDLSISSGNTVDLSGFLTSVPAQTFASLTGTPTTIAGYGITDALALGTTATTALAGDTALFDSTTTNVAIGNNAGNTTQGASAVAIGENAGQITQGTSAVAIGKNAGIGGTTTATYVSGGEADTTLIVDDTTGIKVGSRVSGTGFLTQVNRQPRVLSVDNGTTLTIEYTSDSTPSGVLTFNAQQYNFAIGIGEDAGAYGQQDYTVALGYGAGNFVQDEQAIAIGPAAGNNNQGLGGVAVGSQAGETNQDSHGIAIGKWAGRSDQANEAIAIGYQAGYTGQGAHAIAIGQDAGKTSQAAQSIVLNATGSILDNTQEDSFVVKPVRSVSGGTLPAGFKQVGYNPTTGEFIYLDGV